MIFNARVSHGIAVPCMTTDVSAIKNTMWKIVSACWIPANMGNVAEDNRHGPTESRPGHKSLFSIRHRRKSQRRVDAHRAGDEDQEEGNQEAHAGDWHEPCRKYLQAQHQKHGDLHQPGQPIVKTQDTLLVSKRLSLHDEPRQVHGKKATPV